MSKILVFQHVAYEILGTLNPLLKESGFRIRYINFDRTPEAQPTLDGYQGLVILGGPMNVDQANRYPHLNYEIRLIEEAIQKDMPILGICLGAQLIARALGADVCRNPVREIGWYDIAVTKEGKKDPLLSHFKKKEKIFLWHGDTFEIPKGAVHLAASSDCPNQGFRYGDKVYAFQFHPEVDKPMIERWLKVPDRLKELEELKGKTDVAKIRNETKIHINSLKHLSERTFREFIKLFEKKKKYRRLPSR